MAKRKLQTDNEIIDELLGTTAEEVQLVLPEEVVAEIKESFDNFANPKPEAISPYDDRIRKYYGEGKTIEMLARMFTLHKSKIEMIVNQ